MSNFCTECGAPKATQDERFCGACGSPFAVAPSGPATPAPSGAATLDPEATAVRPAYRPPLAPAAAPAGAPGAAWTQPVPQPGGAQQGPWGTPVAATPRSRRRWGVPLVALAVVAALAGAGLVAWQVLGPRGGASDPETATAAFIEALAAQDPVAALDMVVPAEVAGLDEVYSSAADKLDSMGMSSGDGVTAAVDVELTDLRFDATEVGEDVAVVRLTGGRYAVDVDPASLPAELAFTRNFAPRSYSGDIVGDLSDEIDSQFLVLTTVRIDGRWYVTLLGSYANLLSGNGLDPAPGLREDYAAMGRRLPDPDAVSQEVEPIAGADLEEVLDNLSAAIASGSVDQVLDNLPAEQVVGLRPFVGTIEDILRQEGGIRFSVDVTDLGTGETTEDGDLLTVTVDRATLDAIATEDDGDSDYGSVSLDGSCGYATDEYGTDGGCLPGTFLDTFGVKRPFLVLRDVGEGYQLDPVATAAAYARTAVETIPETVVRDVLRALDDEDDTAACYALGLAELC